MDKIESIKHNIENELDRLAADLETQEVINREILLRLASIEKSIKEIERVLV